MTSASEVMTSSFGSHLDPNSKTLGYSSLAFLVLFGGDTFCVSEASKSRGELCLKTNLASCIRARGCPHARNASKAKGCFCIDTKQ